MKTAYQRVSDDDEIEFVQDLPSSILSQSLVAKKVIFVLGFQRVQSHKECGNSSGSSLLQAEIVTNGFEEKGISFNSQGSQIRVTKTFIFGSESLGRNQRHVNISLLPSTPPFGSTIPAHEPGFKTCLCLPVCFSPLFATMVSPILCFCLMKGSDPYDKMIKIMAVLDALKS
ncbi:hypothetical protein P8452_22062 [Trifolium repens]|nr:hypothetical protein P8452_22062 [Trifolium repens]